MGASIVAGLSDLRQQIIGATANTYATGRTVGTKYTLAQPTRNLLGCVIHSVALADAANQKIAADILFFNADPTASTLTDNSAANLVAADLGKLIGVASLAAADYVAFSATAVAAKGGLGIVYRPSQALGNNLIVAVVTRGAPTYTVNCLTLTLGFLMD